MEEYKPSERQKKCRHALCYRGKNHKQTRCKENIFKDSENDRWVTNEDCEKCEKYKSKYIEYPITVNQIDIDHTDYKPLFHDTGTLVAVNPCDEKFQGKTYIGILIGDIPIQPLISYDEEEQKLNISEFKNPCIFVPELKKLVFGYESWWTAIETEADLKEITQKDIENTWYVKLAKEMLSNIRIDGCNV